MFPAPSSLLPELTPRTTPRLVLTALDGSDWPDFLRMHEDPRVVATLGGPRTRVDVRALFDRLVAQWGEDGFGWWSARDPRHGAFLGRGGLRRVTVEGEPVIEVGYGLVTAAWGRGLATELATESLRVADSVLGLPLVVGFTLASNAASRRVMEKVGLRLERSATYGGLPHVLYSRRRPPSTPARRSGA
ncbi:MAG: GNAT family N-acetyltransferase [Gemmatimonadaceae bacterium]